MMAKMTKEEFIEFLGRDNVMTKDDYEAMHRRISNGELVCFGGPTEASYAHAKHPEKTLVTQDMVDEALRKHGEL